jgi:hypothetical protein
VKRVIWKFPLHSIETVVRTSAHAPIALCGLDPVSGAPALWIKNNPDAEAVDRTFVIYGTGHEIEGDEGFPYDIHVGSVIDGPFVWHVYERRAG